MIHCPSSLGALPIVAFCATHRDLHCRTVMLQIAILPAVYTFFVSVKLTVARPPLLYYINAMLIVNFNSPSP